MANRIPLLNSHLCELFKVKPVSLYSYTRILGLRIQGVSYSFILVFFSAMYKSPGAGDKGQGFRIREARDFLKIYRQQSVYV